jgi:hypothetical protein
MDKQIKENDVKKMVNDEITKFVSSSIDKEVRDLLRKKNSQSREELLNILKQSLESVFKQLWVKRDFWKTDIK